MKDADTWQAVPRTDPSRLQGFQFGIALMRYRPDAARLSWADMANRIALPYNAALCARGLTRWEDDGGQ